MSISSTFFAQKMRPKNKIVLTALLGISYGGLTYFKHLVPALAKVNSNNEYHIFMQKDQPLSKLVRQDNFLFYECPFYVKSGFGRLFWEQFIIPGELKKRKIDILFTAKNSNILLAPCKTIVSVRNMEPLCYMNYQNHWVLNILSWLRGNLTNISIKKADRVVAVSKATKTYLEYRFSEIRHKVDIIYNGNPITSENIEANSRKENLPYLLSASKFVTYANQLNLVKGYEWYNYIQGRPGLSFRQL